MVEKTDYHTKEFDYNYFMFQVELKKLKNHFEKSNKKYSSIYAIPRGGLILGVYLSHMLNIPLVRVIEPNTLVVDDICDTGSTLEQFPNNDKVVLISKTTGYGKIKNLISPLIVTDKTWVKFFWEVK